LLEIAGWFYSETGEIQLSLTIFSTHGKPELLSIFNTTMNVLTTEIPESRKVQLPARITKDGSVLRLSSAKVRRSISHEEQPKKSEKVHEAKDSKMKNTPKAKNLEKKEVEYGIECQIKNSFQETTDAGDSKSTWSTGTEDWLKTSETTKTIDSKSTASTDTHDWLCENSEDSERDLFEKARQFLSPSAFYRFIVYLYAERKLVVFFWIHFVGTMVVWGT
jgi:superfamily II DNA helicase RecQ